MQFHEPDPNTNGISDVSKAQLLDISAEGTDNPVALPQVPPSSATMEETNGSLI